MTIISEFADFNRYLRYIQGSTLYENIVSPQLFAFLIIDRVLILL